MGGRQKKKLTKSAGSLTSGILEVLFALRRINDSILLGLKNQQIVTLVVQPGTLSCEIIGGC